MFVIPSRKTIFVFFIHCVLFVVFIPPRKWVEVLLLPKKEKRASVTWILKRMNQQSVVAGTQHFCLTNHLASDEIFYIQKCGSYDEVEKIIFHTKNEILAIATVFGRWMSAKMIDNGVELRSTKKKCCNGDTIKSAHFHFNQYFSCSSSSWNDIATFSTTTTEKTFLFVSPSQWWHCSLDFSSTTSVGIRNTMEIGCSKEIHNRLSASRISFNQHENEE